MYLRNKADELDEKQKTSGQSSVVSTGGTGQDPNASQAQGTSWVNLGKYLDANKGLGEGVANAVTKDSQDQINSAASKLNEFAAKDQSTQQTKDLQGIKNQIDSDPGKLAADTKSKLSQGYQGPADATKAQGYGDVYNAYGNAKAGYDSLKADDWASRSTAVQNTYGKENPQYSKGMGMLDTFILQGDQTGKDAINTFTGGDNAKMFAADGKDALSQAKAKVQTGIDADRSIYDTLLGGGAGSIAESATNKRAGIDSAATQQRLDDLDNAFNTANSQISDAYTKAGQKAPINTVGYLTPHGGNTEAYYSDADLEALNQLAGLGFGNSVTRSGDKASYDVDWNQVNKDLGDLKGTKLKEVPDAVAAKTKIDKGGMSSQTAAEASDEGLMEKLLKRNRTAGSV